MNRDHFLKEGRRFLLSILLLLAFQGAVAAVISDMSVELTTDKARYNPGQTVQLTATGNIPQNTMVRYRHGATVVEEQPFHSLAQDNKWSWTPPAIDFRGYLVELYHKVGSDEVILGTIAVDVSSDWKRFPRYGFVADFNNYSGTVDKDANIRTEMAYLNRLHINGVQFQDWHWKHHQPVKFESNGTPSQWYQDISKRYIGTRYIKKYIDVQHSYGMKSIFYNLCYGAWEDAVSDGVKKEWGLFKRDNSGNYVQDCHELKDWASDIYLQVPGNSDWQEYMKARNEEVYTNYKFDGFQIDQLGDRGTLYDYNHNTVYLPDGFTSFINAMKASRPEKSLIMNAVHDYGAERIARTGNVDFCYNEVWGGNGHEQFSHLYDVIRNNDRYGDHQLQTVFAAYMNYDKAFEGGSGDKLMNTPGVLLTDAVMFALGGAHIEMGDHMLCREYFPAASLAMTDELKTAMIRYYDFMTAYQNLLRGISSKAASSLKVETTAGNVTVSAWPPRANAIVSFSKNVENHQVVHLLNFRGTSDLSWRDVNGTRTKPTLTENLPLTVTTNRTINKVWAATPDNIGGAVQELAFTQQNGKVSFTVPSLQYWTMVVLESENIEEQLLMTGEAVQRDGYGAYDLHQAVPLKRSDDGLTFTVTTHLKGNKYFKFTNGTDWATCTSFNAEYSGYKFNNSNRSTTVNLLINGSNDYKFMVDADGDYDVIVDLSQLRLKVVKAGESQVKVVLPDELPQETISIFDLRGRAVSCEQYLNGTLPRGIYILKQNGMSRKIIIR
ncbi:MAG: cycloisomaltooligosaccharide glucanotransferase [Prevotella sp.]|nr:cycloisomaltooligosaccharide glucanotransferase [Prevotella sp.]